MKLLLTGAYKFTENQIEKIRILGYDPIFIQDERIPLSIDVDEIEAVICNGLFLYNDISKFKNLKYIQLTSAGLDRVPLDYINQNKIILNNAKGVYSIPMAEWVILKILEIYKDSHGFKISQNNKEWKKNRELIELYGKTAAIFGFGSVGEEVAKRLKCFGVNIVGVGRSNIDSIYIDEFCHIKEKEYALNKSDIVVLTLPLTEDTRHMFNKETLDIMKDKSVLINVSRGGIIDELALLDKVKEKKFLGVALDVFENEPLDCNSKFWEIEEINITPHNSFISDNIMDRLYNLIYDNLRYYKRKEVFYE